MPPRSLTQQTQFQPPHKAHSFCWSARNSTITEGLGHHHTLFLLIAIFKTCWGYQQGTNTQNLLNSSQEEGCWVKRMQIFYKTSLINKVHRDLFQGQQQSQFWSYCIINSHEQPIGNEYNLLYIETSTYASISIWSPPLWLSRIYSQYFILCREDRNIFKVLKYWYQPFTHQTTRLWCQKGLVFQTRKIPPTPFCDILFPITVLT